MPVRRLLSPAQRKSYTVCIFLIIILILGFAAAIPFFWESKSLWYKSGSDKLLLQLGKAFGLFAAVLFFSQIVLAQRLVILDRIFGLDRLYSFHRINSFLILGLAMLHAALVVFPEGLDNLPIGWTFWPEILGALLVIMLAFFIAIASFRHKLLSYEVWRKTHRPAGYLLLVILAIHIFYVSDSFEAGAPLIALWGLIAAAVLTIIFARLYTAKMTLKQVPVSSSRLVGEDIVAMRVTVPSSFTYAAGQFAFLQLHGKEVSPETHPFSIASAPGLSGKSAPTLEFFIKQCGDWTDSIQPGEEFQASLTAPFGLFSYQARPLPPMLICIAGGIGITPLLSMLRQLCTEQHLPQLMLIWTLARKTDMFLTEELGDLKARLPNLQTHIVYTREEGGHRLNKDALRGFLKNVSLESHFYICGPEKMMHAIRRDLQQMQFDQKSIFWEQFSL